MSDTEQELVAEVKRTAQAQRNADARLRSAMADRNLAIINALIGGISERTVAAAAGIRKGNIHHLKRKNGV